MDRYLTFNGEQPLWLNDFNFMQDATQNALTQLGKAIMRDFEGEFCILCGCTISYTTDGIEWTDGVVMLDTEILPIEKGSCPYPNGNTDHEFRFDIVDEFLTAGERTFKNGKVYRCYDRRKATIVESNGLIAVSDVPKLEEYLREENHIIYYVTSMDANGLMPGSSFRLIHPFGGGWYLQGIVKYSAKLIQPGDNILRKSLSDNIKLNPGRTFTTVTFIPYNGSGAAMTVPITIDVENNNIGIRFPTTVRLEEVEGMFYCRLFER